MPPRARRPPARQASRAPSAQAPAGGSEPRGLTGGRAARHVALRLLNSGAPEDVCAEEGLYELLALVPGQLGPRVDSQEDLTFLLDMFGEKSLHSLVKWFQ
ncbi:uncharacterized protein [Vulpes vulpes]|uniref:Uncharacterized protein isoform X2 n=1 Tax=Vulpes vulpes TaxID=9627 RepID=A0ABM4ZSG1_VULVU